MGQKGKFLMSLRVRWRMTKFPRLLLGSGLRLKMQKWLALMESKFTVPMVTCWMNSCGMGAISGVVLMVVRLQIVPV